MRRIWGRSSPASLRLELAWIKGHSEAQGNSKADEKAKAAVEGNISLDQDLPEIFWVEAHPVSSSAMQQAQAAELKARWRMHWTDSPHFTKLSKIDPMMPSNKFQRLIAGFNRFQASILTQLHVGHIPLNAYLHRIKQAASLDCLQCGVESETVHHFLFNCQAWRSERWAMGKVLQCEAKLLQHILSHREGAEELLRFIGRTERFKATHSTCIS